MEAKTQTFELLIETLNETLLLTVDRMVEHEGEENMTVSLATVIRDEKRIFSAETTEKALYKLANALPDSWRIKSCLSCRHGNFCPTGNSDNELFCNADRCPKEPRDLWDLTEDDSERTKRSRTLFQICEKHEDQSQEDFTYSDYLHTVRR